MLRKSAEIFTSTIRAAAAKFAGSSSAKADYQARVAEEKQTYQECTEVHELPLIFHYWSNRYLRPKLEAFGFSNPYDFFDKYLEIQCRREPSRQVRFVSIGSGNCDMEIAASRKLCEKGLENFKFECLELNDAMLKRGRVLAGENSVADKLVFVEGDFNRWRPAEKFDAVIANQSLHHVLKLEDLLASVKKALKPGGLFLISDMIGRNGHMRWPEALEIVHEFWESMPPSYKYNHQLKKTDLIYDNWDCSNEGFEGIRAQDILPLLIDLFSFELFIAFGNVIDPFIDRGFGPNFDPGREWDRSFIDRIHERDEHELISGHIKPTHMIGVLRAKPFGGPFKYHDPLTPQFSVRRP